MTNVSEAAPSQGNEESTNLGGQSQEFQLEEDFEGYRIEVSSNREIIKHIDLEKPFQEFQSEEDPFAIFATIDMYDKETRIAHIFIHVFDEYAILNAGETLDDVADMINGDVHVAMFELERSKIFKKKLDPNLDLCFPFSCYIDTFYVEPKYRRQGIAKYLLKNLYDIILYCFNAHVRCFVTFPHPQQAILTDGNITMVDLPDENGIMKHLIVSVIQEAGYKEIGTSGHFAVNCMTAKAEKQREKDMQRLDM